MSETYFIIFWNYFWSMCALPTESPYALEAALYFKAGDPTMLTLAAWLGSMLGALLDFGLGYGIGHTLQQNTDSTIGKRIAESRETIAPYAPWFMAISWIPFGGIIPLIVGLTTSPAKRSLTLLVAGHAAYLSILTATLT